MSFLSFFLQGFLITLLGIIAIPVTFFNHLRNTIMQLLLFLYIHQRAYPLLESKEG
jgi:hypothetical protein